MKISRGRWIQLISVFVVHVITLFILSWLLSGFQADSLRALMVFTISLGIAQAVLRWLFVRYFPQLPGCLYPILAFVLNGFFVLGDWQFG